MASLTTFDDLYPGRFLKAGLLHGKHVTLTIRAVRREELDSGKEKKMQAIVSFDETQMELVTCKTNGILLRSLFGDILAEWVGRKVTLGPDVWNGDPCIRVMGSPELETERAVVVQLPRRAPMTRKLLPTGKKTQKTREPGEEG